MKGPLTAQANKMVLVYNQFRLTTVIEAAMEIAGMQAAQKRLHVRLSLAGCFVTLVTVIAWYAGSLECSLMCAWLCALGLCDVCYEVGHRSGPSHAVPSTRGFGKLFLTPSV